MEIQILYFVIVLITEKFWVVWHEGKRKEDSYFKVLKLVKLKAYQYFIKIKELIISKT